jgi:hypothetical protein
MKFDVSYNIIKLKQLAFKIQPSIDNYVSENDPVGDRLTANVVTVFLVQLAFRPKINLNLKQLSFCPTSILIYRAVSILSVVAQ